MYKRQEMNGIEITLAALMVLIIVWMAWHEYRLDRLERLSLIHIYAIINSVPNAGVAEQADARDLKYLGGDIVPVQVRSPAPGICTPM